MTDSWRKSLQAGLLVGALVAVFVFALVHDRSTTADLHQAQEKAKRYDLYCQLLKESLRQAARDLGDREHRANAARWTADRMEARLASDDVMGCGTAAFDLGTYRECLTRDDYACLLDVVIRTESTIPLREGEH